MENILQFLKVLGFLPKDGEDSVYAKRYDDYEISINYNEVSPEKSIINYGKKITQHRGTTGDFHQSENMVVLECVDRLLSKGYKPEKIELEKCWALGHKDKGFLDIWVKDENNKSFLMIECKTWGSEYEKAKKETLTNKKKFGGQIFSYLQQEPKDTKAICYYTSKMDKGKIFYENAIVYNKDDWKDLSQEERYPRWNEIYETNGIFEDWVNLYALQSKALIKKDLKQLDANDSGIIYNKFAEILRHNVISDKPNAFNKIINLFLCKVCDEDRDDEEELKFQIRNSTGEKTNEELLEDLNDLYKKGMESYLQKEVPDYTKDEFERMISKTGAHKEELEQLYTTLRLYKNNEFAFKEVFDKKSFDDNAVVVREVVELLQSKQLRYSHKQQFLGDFFEKLLNDSIKQEAGQFFTPVPLAQFIIKSLPVKEFILNKIKKGDTDALPYVIDFACGAGHFLTEMMDEIQHIIVNDIRLEDIKKPTLKEDFETWKRTNFKWADKYIYGIDMDYRLIKTSKISCFLNGDGLANLIHSNGLAKFDCKDYLKILKNEDGNKDNQKFDIIIANPPYSVKYFKNTLPFGAQCFDLYDGLTENSSEIECLFVERAKQLLKKDGFIGIILPSSFLTNGGTYIKAREIILKYFDVKAIMSLDNNAFMATGTKTIVLFMQRRDNLLWQEIQHLVDKFFTDYKDVTINGIEKAFSTYVKDNFDDLEFEDYVSILKNSPTSKATESELFRDYKGLSNDDIRNIEYDKLLYFTLSYPQKVVVANSGSKDAEKEFLGYDFSNRKGCEGIDVKKDVNGHIISNMYSDTALDDSKVNYYIYNNFNGVDISSKISEINNTAENHPLKGHITYERLSTLIDFSLPVFDKKIDINVKKKIKIESKYSLGTLDNLLSLLESGNRPKGGVSNIKQGIPSLGGEHIGTNGYLFLENLKYCPEEYFANAKNGIIHNNDILICKDGALTGKLALVRGEFNNNAMVNEHIFILRADENKLLQKYLFNYFLSPEGQILIKSRITGQAVGGLNRENLLKLSLPLPEMDVQHKIVSEIDVLEDMEQKLKEEKSYKQNLLNEMFLKLYKSSKTFIRLGNQEVFKLSIGKRILNKDLISDGKIPVYSANVFQPFGYINSLLIKDFETPSILWGIDGDWMVNYVPENKKFYPTDHCGVLRVKQHNLILEKYAAFALLKVGLDSNFNRSNRASIDKIQALRIPVPSIDLQKEVISKVVPIEESLKDIQNKLEAIPLQKQEILDKYLK